MVKSYELLLLSTRWNDKLFYYWVTKETWVKAEIWQMAYFIEQIGLI